MGHIVEFRILTSGLREWILMGGYNVKDSSMKIEKRLGYGLEPKDILILHSFKYEKVGLGLRSADQAPYTPQRQFNPEKEHLSLRSSKYEALLSPTMNAIQSF